jgi:hypothetical protein
MNGPHVHVFDEKIIRLLTITGSDNEVKPSVEPANVANGAMKFYNAVRGLDIPIHHLQTTHSHRFNLTKRQVRIENCRSPVPGVNGQYAAIPVSPRLHGRLEMLSASHPIPPRSVPINLALHSHPSPNPARNLVGNR